MLVLALVSAALVVLHAVDVQSDVPVIGENVVLPSESVVAPGVRVALLKYSHSILATGRFNELGIDERNIYFKEKIR